MPSAEVGSPICSCQLGNRQLRGQDCRAGLIAILADLPAVAALGFRQRSHGPVVDHQHVDAAEPNQQTAQTAVGARQRQIAEQRYGARVECRVAVTAGLLRQRAGNEALAPSLRSKGSVGRGFRAGRSTDSHRLARVPFFLRKGRWLGLASS